MSKKRFLLGSGERLTSTEKVKRNGGSKAPPYKGEMAAQRASNFLRDVSGSLHSVPKDACPGGRAVICLTLHPRFISKSDFPSELLARTRLSVVGGKSTYVEPELWGVEKHPDGAITDTLFVAGDRGYFQKLAEEVFNWDTKSPAFQQLQYLERLYAPSRFDRIKRQLQGDEEGVYEAVLHSGGVPEILDAFYKFARQRGGEPIENRVRFAEGVIFVPVETGGSGLEEIADFSFLRAIRKMPALRSYRPPILRSDSAPLPDLPPEGEAQGPGAVAIFDGGIPADSPLMPWVNYIEPPGISAPNIDGLAHGEQVTSAFLFGHVTPDTNMQSPYARVDHIRVVDDKTGESGSLELYDVLDRILAQLDGAEDPYQFINLSIGPDLPIDDDEITAWTAELDSRASHGRSLITCAAGNSGELDMVAQLNRIQPPSDGVNMLAVGACNSLDDEWARCSYSSIGPGRTPGVAKPDGVAFGGDFARPFGVVSSANGIGLSGTQGTSFAAPFTLRSAVGIYAASSEQLQPLSLRALMVHKAEAKSGLGSAEVGWGRFPDDPITAISCSESEVTVVYQGSLPIGEYLRAPLPMPPQLISGMVDISATLVIAPDVDPSFANAYTKAGLEVIFRPNSEKVKSAGAHAASASFFSTKNLYKESEYVLRSDGHKWEPCLKATRRKQGGTLVKPCFDIYYHHRNQGRAEREPSPIPYAFVVTISAPRVKDLYDQVLQAYSSVLVPIEPILDVPVSV